MTLTVSDRTLLDILLESWHRNNCILVNLLRLIPADGFEARATAGSPSVAQMFNHIHFVRLVFIAEDAPEFATDLPGEEWAAESDPDHLTTRLNASAAVVRSAIQSRVMAGRGTDLHYDHPILLLQHMIWHEGYHHGQIKLALKLAGLPLCDDVAGPVTWGVWMRKM